MAKLLTNGSPILTHILILRKISSKLHTVKLYTVELHTIKSHTVKSHTVKSQTIKLHTIKSHIYHESHNYNVDLKYILGLKAILYNGMNG
jgi:hypothetical protein